MTKVAQLRRTWKREWVFLRARVAGPVWRSLYGSPALSDGSVMTFVIPLIGRASARNWTTVNRQLAVTLASLLSQSDARWRVMICGQDRPDLDLSDGRIEHVPYPVAADPKRVTDKYQKIRFILGRLRRTNGRDGYVFLLDADDILHPDLVGHALRQGAPGGYLIDKGYVLDTSSGDMGWLGPPDASHPKARPFHEHCGSCSAIRANAAASRRWVIPLRFRGQHNWQEKSLLHFGLKLEHVPFPAAIYAINHGENTRERRGTMSAKTHYLQNNRLSELEARAVQAEFGLDGLECTAAWLFPAAPE